jgi:hypothetical protein
MLYPSKFGFDPLFPSSKDFKVIVKDDNSGLGVICYKSFNKGDMVARIAGEIVQDLRQHTLQIDKNNHLYDTYFSGFFLHSCDPNISLNMKDMSITALNDIEANSFLYMDYSQTEDVLYKQFQCCCGSRKCRGWITGKMEASESIPPMYNYENNASGTIA